MSELQTDYLQTVRKDDGTPINAAYNADCLEILPTLPNNCVDFAFMDLPYATETNKFTANDWDQPMDLPALFEQLNRVCKKSAVMAFTCNDRLKCALINANPDNFKYSWVWIKNRGSNFLNAKKQPLTQHEYIAVFYRQTPTTYNPQFSHSNKLFNFNEGSAGSDNYRSFKKKASKDLTGRRYPTSILGIPHDKDLTQTKAQVPDKLERHPTQKPVGLLEYLIKTYTNEGATILDPTAGTLTAAVAAINTKRNYIVCERLEKYFNIGVRRIERRQTEMGNELKFESEAN